MFCGPVQRPKANKEHRCTSCGEQIEKDSIYVRWASAEDAFFDNKMHEECYLAHCELANRQYEHDWEYTPFSYERGKAE